MSTNELENRETDGPNPFSFSLIFPCRIESGLESNGVSFRIKENSHCVMLYAREFFPVYNKLNKPGQAIAQYILCKLAWQQDKMELKPDKVGLSKTPFYNGIAALIEQGVVAKAKRVNMYWLNPTFFFRGNRLRVYPHAIQFSKESEIAIRVREQYVRSAAPLSAYHNLPLHHEALPADQ